MYTPYEVIVKSILPAVRSALVKELSEKYGYKQVEIAKMLDITQASVSYYLTHSRGKYLDEISKYPDIIEMIRKLARDIHIKKFGRREILRRINEIIMYTIAKEYICEVHKNLEPDLNVEECKVCEEIISRKTL